MTFVNDNGEVLDFDGDFAITKRAVSFFNSKIQGDYSINFQVDNNSVNRKVLGYDGPQMLNQVAFTRQSFTLMRNGNPYLKGSIVIQQDLGETLDCYFVSGNSNWIQLLKGLITELDYSGVTNVTNYETLWTAANVFTGMSATSGVIFPMVDWCYDLNKGGNEWFVATLYDASVDVFNTYCEWYPCFYLHTLVQEIAKQNELKINGSIIQNKLYQSLVIAPIRGDMRRTPINATTAVGSAQASLAGPAQKYTALTEASDPEDRFASAAYTANKTSKLILTITIVSITGGGTGTNLVIFKNGVESSSFPNIFSVVPGQTGQFVSVQTAVSGDVFELYLNNVVLSGATVTVNLKIEIPTIISAGDLIKPNYFLPELTCLDIIKFIVSFFGCSAYFSENTKTLELNIIEGLRETDAIDWSDYFDSIITDYTIESAEKNYLRVQESDDSSIKSYNKEHIKRYGEGVIETGNTLKKQQDICEIPFAASEFAFSKNEAWVSNIPLVKMEDAGDPILYTSIFNNGGDAAFEHGGINSFTEGLAVRIVDDNSGDLGIYIVDNVISSTRVTFFDIPFVASSTGKLYTQKFAFNQVSPRLLVVKPETSIADFSNVANYRLYDSSFTPSTKTATAFAFYSKPSVGLTIDSMTANAAFNNPDIDKFNSPDVQQLYFNKISRMLGNPTFKVMMTLPESVFQAFKFESFIYLKTKDLTGYFWVESIQQYRDGQTKVQVNLLSLN